MKKFFLTFILLLTGSAFATEPQQTYRLEITPETSERWWGIDRMGAAWSVYQREENPAMPFVSNMLISNTGRYVFSAEPFTVGRGENGKMTIESYHEQMEVRKSGSTLREAYLMCVHRHLGGERRMPAVELFSRPVYRLERRPDTTWGQDEIVAFARRIVAEGLPTGIIVVPEGWASPHILLGFDRELFPNVPAMLGELRELGFKTMLTITPNTPLNGRVFTEAYRNGHLAHDREILDIGNDVVFATFRTRVAQLISEYGFDGYAFANGGGSPVGNDDHPFLLNWEKLAEGVEMCIVTGTYKRAFTSYASDVRPALSPDLTTESLLASSLSGDIYKILGDAARGSNPFDDSDFNEQDRAIWTILSLFFPVAAVDYAPWNFERQDLRNKIHAALQLRASMAEYMESTVRELAKTGEPIIQHMEYRFPKQGFSDCDDQFMLGSRYLIAPSLDGAPKRMVRLPRGRWRTPDGRTLRGPLVLEADCSAAGVAYFEFMR
ncbi:MAG: hypothetical protein FWE10_06865 [Rikenellaceae bacterium]|nr:hypothetical protein [Rikenellaceae bacterium]MCL2693387.1 hypothetical protein [Rikenellaceae bacterium]